jgi:hypothetical protein
MFLSLTEPAVSAVERLGTEDNSGLSERPGGTLTFIAGGFNPRLRGKLRHHLDFGFAPTNVGSIWFSEI